ncbi:MAG: hypothetical protein V1859_09425 [archaeon]
MKIVSQQEIWKKRYKSLNIDKRIIIGGLALLILGFFIDIKRIGILCGLVFLNCMLLSLDRYISMPVDLEFSTFSAILFSTVYGLKWGLVAGAVTKLAAMFYNANIRLDHFFMIGGYCMSAVFASILTPFHIPILYVGLICVIIVNIYIVFVSKYITALYAFEIFMYGTSNIIFNFLLFMAFAEPMLMFMRL